MLFHLNVVRCLANKQTHKTHQNYHLTIHILSFVRKTIDSICLSQITPNNTKIIGHKASSHLLCTVSIHHVCCGIGRHVNYGSSLCLTWKVNSLQWDILPQHVIWYKTRCKWQFYFSAGQCIGISRMQHSPTAGEWNSQLHSFWLCPSLNSVEVYPIDYKI